jgi:uncharacterized integral membrane protein (TIGR00698 family)
MSEKRRTALGIISGIALLAATGIAALYLSSFFSAIIKVEWLRAILSANVVVAILVGMLLGNLVLERIKGLAEFLAPGLELYDLFLKTGIILLGARIIAGDLLRLGAVGLGMVVIKIVASIFFVIFFARLFGLPERLSLLLAGGIGVCGVTAIVGTSEVTGASREETSYAIATILLFGTGAILFYPLVGRLLGMNHVSFGIWAGLAIENTPQVIAAGAIYDQVTANAAETAKIAGTVTKMCRNALVGFVILGFALYYARKGLSKGVEHKGRFLWRKFPKFVLGFILFAVLASLGLFGPPQSIVLRSFAVAERWAFLFTFAGVGLATRFKDMARISYKPLLVGLLAEVIVASLTLLGVLLLGKPLTLSF